MVPWSIYILTFLYNFTFGALVGESPRAGAMIESSVEFRANRVLKEMFCGSGSNRNSVQGVQERSVAPAAGGNGVWECSRSVPGAFCGSGSQERSRSMLWLWRQQGLVWDME
jgi:hypothetical protein